MAGAAYMNPPAPPKPMSPMPATTPAPLGAPPMGGMATPASTPQSVARAQVAPAPPPPPAMAPGAPSGGRPAEGQMTAQGTPTPPQGASSSSPESGIQDGTQAQPGQAGAPGNPARPFVPYFTPDHFGQMQPGESADTPMGTVSRGPDGQPHILLSEQGRAHHAKLRAEEVTRYGDHPFKSLPGAPQPPITPGSPHFNPFSGRFTDGWE
jgi:hypothetical protein